MDTLALVLRYGFLVALLTEAIYLGITFRALLREKARVAPPAPEPAAPQE